MALRMQLQRNPQSYNVLNIVIKRYSGGYLVLNSTV